MMDFEALGVRAEAREILRRRGIQEATPVQDGDYDLHYALLEDGIVAAQEGSSANHIHNNVLRSMGDSETFTGAKAGVPISWETELSATKEQRIVAFVCRGGIVQNVSLCHCGQNLGYQYEP